MLIINAFVRTTFCALQLVGAAAWPEPRYKLLGTVEAGEESRALIETENKGIEIFCALSRECRRDNCACHIEGATILSIGHEHIWLNDAGRRIKIETGKSLPAPGTIPHRTNLSLTKEAPPEFAPNMRILLREIERARWVTVFAKGNTHEHLAAVLKPLGLRPDDEIKRVQGQAYDPAAAAPPIALKEAREVKIEIERAGRPIVFKIQIRD